MNRCRLLSALIVFLMGVCFQSLYGQAVGEGLRQEYTVPNPMNLSPQWWNDFEGNAQLLEKRTEELKELFARIESRIQDEAPKIRFIELKDKILRNLSILSQLKQASQAKEDATWIPKRSYTIEEYFALFDNSRLLNSQLENRKLELEWYATQLNETRQSVNSSFSKYIGLTGASLDKLFLGMEVIQGQTKFAYMNREQELLQSKLEETERLLKSVREELNFAINFIDYDAIDSARYVEKKEKLENSLSGVQKALVSLETSSIILDGSGPKQSKAKLSTSIAKN